jgi:hypothetical protein
MPTLILQGGVKEAAAVAPSTAELMEAAPAAAPALSPQSTHTSKTPKKTNTASRKSKVTPGSASTKKTKKKDEEPQSAKKQKTIMSFFTKPATKPKPAAVKTVKAASPPTTMMATTTDKPGPFGVDKESLREIVVGSVVTPLLSSNRAEPVDYEKHKGSPMPTNLKQPSFLTARSSSPRERLLDRLNQHESDDFDSSQTADDCCDLALAQPSQDDAKAQVTQPAPQDHAIVDAPANIVDDDVDDDDDDEKTVHFSQESSDDGEQQPINDISVEISLEQSNSDKVLDVEFLNEPAFIEEATDEPVVVEETMRQSEAAQLVVEEPSPVKECIVDMTQMEESDAAQLAEEETLPVKECIVDMTQMEWNEDSSHCKDADVEMEEAEEKMEDVTQIDQKEEEIMEPTMDSTADKATDIKTPRSARRKAPPQKLPVKVTKSPERLALVEKNGSLRNKSIKRRSVLTERVSKGLEEEIIDMPSPSTIQADAFDEELSQQAVVKLAVIVQERYVLF